MDNLTHGLLGLAVAALRRPDGEAGNLSATDKAVLLAAVIAAELPDLDSLWPTSDPVMRDLQAHRGPSHSLLLAPVIALVAMGLAKLLFRGARLWPTYLFSLLSVVFAHLIPDLWTGWGTRVLLPFSSHRFAWDVTMVVDPWVTLPLLAGAFWAWRVRKQAGHAWRKAVLFGLAASMLYVGARAALLGFHTAAVRTAYPQATNVQVFPAWFSLTRWRYVAVFPNEYAAGSVGWQGVAEAKRPSRPQPDLLPEGIRAIPTVREALMWARFPVVQSAAASAGGTVVRIADLRYHLNGDPTLTFVLQIDGEGRLTSATLDRGGSASQLLERWRKK